MEIEVLHTPFVLLSEVTTVTRRADKGSPQFPISLKTFPADLATLPLPL
jgi:hypothetical protein